MRRLSWGAMAVLAVLVAVYSLTVATVPSARPPFIGDRMTAVPLAVIVHLAGGAVAIVIGACQMNSGLRNRYRRLHRWAGRVYVCAVLAAGVAALVLASMSQLGLVTHVGFGLLGALWLTTTLLAYLHIRRGDHDTHRRWMIRSYALTYAAVTLRIILPMELIAGISFDDAYRVVAWACWVPNLIFAEWWVLRPPSGGAT